ncbi:transmembrane protein 255B isoform X2 [Erpetoichthys calabaricus]|uniref:transmembrane protein 255B isoform X2 n=1 Tax=Erpetoichthys calabaricus TaxID=27687 RepID=UPI002234D47F|nr:transmembrane protein 255B isoform X2 [Erpetoichthys calabaricus]
MDGGGRPCESMWNFKMTRHHANGPWRDPVNGRRRKKVICLVSTLLVLSLLITAVGIVTTTGTESVSVTGYGSGIIFVFGSFLGILGLVLEENRNQLLLASIIFLSFGVIAAFFCLIVDGVFIVMNIDLRPLHAGRCQYYGSGHSYLYENLFASVTCQGLTESCNLQVRSGTCYCCDLYECANGGYLNNHYEFVGVKSCQDVLSLYMKIWLLIVLNFLAFFLGILTTAVLGSMRNMREHVSCSDLTTRLLDPSPTRQSPDDQNHTPALCPSAPFLQEAAVMHHFAAAVTKDQTPGSITGGTKAELSSPPFAPLCHLMHGAGSGYLA